jgi:outer membrane protein OmpA-like peptidoglycan-associated protein
MKKPFKYFTLFVFFASCMNSLAQRESFDATVTRKADVLIVEMQPANGGASVRRSGFSAEGNRMVVDASARFVSFDNIFFKLDSTELRDDASRLQVNEIATALLSRELKSSSFLIEGHTCDLGEDDHNLKLSAKRADAIRKLLIKQGVGKNRLAALGFGESDIVDPVKASDSPSKAETKRMKSRRVVLRELKPQKK